MKLVVEKEDELLNYLYNHLDMPKKTIKQYLTHGSIFVNNNRTHNPPIHKCNLTFVVHLDFD